MPHPGEPVPKTLFDHLDAMPMFAKLADELKQKNEFLALFEPEHRPSFKDSMSFLARLTGISPADPSGASTLKTVHAYAMARPWGPVIWQLDTDVYEALLQTEPPWSLVRDRLPKLPYPAMMVRLPVGHAIQTDLDIHRPVNVEELIVIEEVPERKWRLLGAEQSRNIGDIATQHGWFDIGEGAAVAQMPKYAETGENAMWQLLINLFLALEHRNLAQTDVIPRVPRNKNKREKLLRRASDKPYSAISLSAASQSRRAEADARRQSATTETGRKAPVRHLVRGHWHGFWKNDPGGLPVFKTKPRFDNDGHPTGEYSYLVAK